MQQEAEKRRECQADDVVACCGFSAVVVAAAVVTLPLRHASETYCSMQQFRLLMHTFLYPPGLRDLCFAAGALSSLVCHRLSAVSRSKKATFCPPFHCGGKKEEAVCTVPGHISPSSSSLSFRKKWGCFGSLSTCAAATARRNQRKRGWQKMRLGGGSKGERKKGPLIRKVGGEMSELVRQKRER